MSDLPGLSVDQKTVLYGRLVSVVNTVERAFTELYDVDLSIRLAKKNLNGDGTVETGSALVRLNDIVEDLEHLIDRLAEEIRAEGDDPNGPK